MKGIVGADLEKYVRRVFDDDDSRSWAVSDVQRLVDARARLNGDARVPHIQTVRVKLIDLVHDGVLYLRESEPDERNPHTRGVTGARLYARVSPVPHASWSSRQELLKDVPPSREYPTRVGARSGVPERPPMTTTDAAETDGQDTSARVSAQDFPRRAEIICTMVRELVKDLDGTTVTRARLQKLETYSNWQTGEIARLRERNERLERQLRNVERARKLLETPNE